MGDSYDQFLCRLIGFYLIFLFADVYLGFLIHVISDGSLFLHFVLICDSLIDICLVASSSLWWAIYKPKTTLTAVVCHGLEA